MTADELLAMPHNGYRYELVQGELRQMELAGRQHGHIAAISPNDRYSETKEKVSDWLRAGTQMVAVIDPHQHTATVNRAPDDICILTEGDMLDGGDVVLGWKMPLADVF